VNREEIIAELQRMSVPELVSVFRDAFAPHHPGTRQSGVTDDRYILAVARRDVDPDRSQDDPPCTIEAVAYPDPAEYDLGPDWGLCQQGTCRSCRIVVCSNVKRGTCPSCGSNVSLT
jgi:hypothetical protein